MLASNWCRASIISSTNWNCFYCATDTAVQLGSRLQFVGSQCGCSELKGFSTCISSTKGEHGRISGWKQITELQFTSAGGSKWGEQPLKRWKLAELRKAYTNKCSSLGVLYLCLWNSLASKFINVFVVVNEWTLKARNDMYVQHNIEASSDVCTLDTSQMFNQFQSTW